MVGERDKLKKALAEAHAAFALPAAPEKIVDRVEMPAALGEQGKYDASVAAAIIHGKFGLHMRNANLMSVVASAHRHDLDIQAYLTDVITHLNRGTARPADLLPDVWKQSHPEAIRQYREEERRDKAELARLRGATRRVGI